MNRPCNQIRLSRSPRSRRAFLAQCAACAGCACLSGFGRAQPAGSKPKIRAVFCETDNTRPIWPNVGYDFESRRRALLNRLLTECPELEFLPAVLMDRPDDAQAILQQDHEVQGYVLFLQGLGWRNDIVSLCKTGKPTLLVDNLFGGSGLFLTRISTIRNLQKPVDWVASANDDDIVASVRAFRGLAEGKSADQIAAAFREIRRQRTARSSPVEVQADAQTSRPLEQVLDELKQTTVLVVGGTGWGGEQFREAAARELGLKFQSVSFEELRAAYQAAPESASRELAQTWIRNAERVIEPTEEEIIKSARMFYGMKSLMDRYQARGITVNCLGGFYGGHLDAYPCLGFVELNNQGLVGGCEADQMSALTMMVIGLATGRPGYISDPVVDTSTYSIIYAHCVAMTRPFGSTGPANPYRIRNHSEDRKGAAVQSLLPAGYVVTTLEINPVQRAVRLHRARTVGNHESDMACRTKLIAVVSGDLEKLVEEWQWGWHRVTFYGDWRPLVEELCQRCKFQLIDEA